MTVVLTLSLMLNAGALVLGCLLAVDLRRTRGDLRVAQERLYGAWKDGYQLPAAPDEPLPPAEDALIPELESIINDWDDPVARKAQASFIRSEIAKGKTQLDVLHSILPVAPADDEVVL